MTDISVYEVGPRDGLQSASVSLSTGQKVQMITSLHESGINSIEVGSFVHPRRVPNMADSEDVYLGVADLKCKLGVWFLTSGVCVGLSLWALLSSIFFCLLLKPSTKTIFVWV